MNPLRRIKRFFDGILGTLADKIYWKAYYLLTKEDKEENLNHPYKEIFLKEISSAQPFEKVLEIGCGAGFNLYELAKKLPDKKFYGIDVSGGAIRQGRKFFKKNKIENVFLQKASAEDLSFLADKSMDIIFSYATIMYIGPEKIKKATEEMLRVADKKIILCEYHSCSAPFYNDHWIYDYNELFKNLVKEKNIKITKLPKEKNKGDWAEYGNIIKIELK